MIAAFERKDGRPAILDVAWASTEAPLTTILAGAVESASASLGGEIVGLLRLLPDGQSLLLEAGVGWRPGVVGEVRLPLDADEAMSHALATGEPVTAPIAPSPLSEEPGIGGGTVVRVGHASRPYGLLAAYPPRGAPAPTDAGLLVAVANVLTLALDHHHAGALLQALVDRGSDLVARFDPQLRYVWVNPAYERVTGRRSEELSGRTDREAGTLPTALLERWELALGRAAGSGREQEIDLLIPTPIQERLYHVRLVSEDAADGSVESVIAIGRDVTDERRALDERGAVLRELLAREERLQHLPGQIAQERHQDRQDAQMTVAGRMIAEQLTPRQVEILSLLSSGKTNRQIGRMLSLSPGTVRNSLGRVFLKLGVADRTQAAVRAVELGLVKPDGSWLGE